MMLTISKTKELVNALVKIRELLTDEQAVQVLSIFPAWKVGDEMKAGSRVQYREELYKVLEDCKAEETPDMAAELYRRL